MWGTSGAGSWRGFSRAERSRECAPIIRRDRARPGGSLVQQRAGQCVTCAMAADVTPTDPPDEAERDPSGDVVRPRSLRPVLIAAVLALAGMWWLGSSVLGSEIQHAIQHVFL